MKALVKYDLAPGCAELREVPGPEPGPGEVLVRVKAAGLCGTDMEVFRGEFPAVIPVIMGHEGSGLIERLGPGCDETQLSPGMPVVIETSKFVCGKCVHCRSGRYNLCPRRKGLGYGADGVFAEYVTVPWVRLHRLPEGLDLEEAAAVETVSVACRAVLSTAKVTAGQSVLVIGSGPIGILVGLVARAAGARPVVLMGRTNRKRIERALQAGMDACILAAEEKDPVDAVTRALGGPADAVFEASGDPEAVSVAIDAARPGGQVILAGLYPKASSVEWNRLVTTERILKGTWTSGVYEDWENAIKLIERKAVDLGLVITHRFKLSEWETAFATAERGESIKALLIP